MHLDTTRIWPYLIAVAAVLLVYRRLRRSFGPQRLRPARMSIRIGILVLLATILTPGAMSSLRILLTDVACLMAGVALAVWGSRRTRFQEHASQLYYIPHTYSGIAVSLLLVGRLVYRLVLLHSMGAVGAREGAFPFDGPAVFKSAATVAMLCVVIGYYVFYYGWLLWKAKHISPEDLETVPTLSIDVSPLGLDGSASG